MRGGIRFRPYVLLSRTPLSAPDAPSEVILLRFAVSAEERGGRLGLSQPTVHVKVRMPDSWLPRARTFSLVSEEDADGYFEIAVKVIPGGRVSPYLQTLPIGAPAYFSRTLPKRLVQPLDTPGRALAVVVFGIGVAECVLTVRRATRAGQRVVLVYAVRTSKDVVFLDALCALAAASQGSFELHLLVSREEPSADLCALLQSAGGASVHAVRGRVDLAVLGRIFGGPAWAAAKASRSYAVLAVGNRVQTRNAYALLRAVGLRQRLLGLPVPWGCW